MPLEATAPPVEVAVEGAPPRTGGAPLLKLASELRTLQADHFDTLSVTALLESTGLRDVDARERFGAADTFALGELLFPALPVPVPHVEIVGDREARLGARLRRFARWYAAG